MRRPIPNQALYLLLRQKEGIPPPAFTAFVEDDDITIFTDDDEITYFIE